MEQYQSLAKAIEGMKRPLIIIAVASMVVHLIILGTGIFIGKSNKKETYSTFEACYQGMKALFNNDATEEHFNKDVLKEAGDQKFAIESITLVKVIDGLSCDVVAKDNKGIRSFHVGLEKSTNFSHFYRIVDVKGQKIESSYQLGDSL